MKRILLLTLLTIVLTACGNDNKTGGEESAEENENQGSSQSGEDTTETEETEDEKQDEAEASEIIDEAIAEWGDTSSYEARQTFTITSEDAQSVVRTITTQSEQNEVKVEVDNGNVVTSHYIIDGDHFTYQDGSIKEEEKSIDISGSTYGEIVKGLEAFKEGDASRTDSGYQIQLPVNSSEDVSKFLSDEVLKPLDEAENLNGQITITLNDEYQYTGGELTLTAVTAEGEINMISNLEFSRISEIEVLEKPKNM